MSDQADLPPDESAVLPPLASAAATARAGEGRYAIVRRQFRKNRTAVWGLRVALALAHVAIFAPVIASGDPFIYRAPGGALQFPWIAHLVDVISWEHSLDRAFNVLMVVMTLYWVAYGVFRLVKLLSPSHDRSASGEPWSRVQRGALTGTRRWTGSGI